MYYPIVPITRRLFCFCGLCGMWPWKVNAGGSGAPEGCAAIDNGFGVSEEYLRGRLVSSSDEAGLAEFCTEAVKKIAQIVFIDRPPKVVFFSDTKPNFIIFGESNTIYLEKGMARDLFFVRSDDGWPICLLAVLMHELGHSIQFSYNYFAVFKNSLRSVRCREGHADFLAGMAYWLFFRGDHRLNEKWGLALNSMFSVVPLSNFSSPAYNADVYQRKDFMYRGVQTVDRYLKSGNWNKAAFITCANEGAELVLATLDRR
jgi:hypothetical protein